MSLIALGLAVFAWNTVVTIGVLRTAQYELVQKVLQIVLTWVVPIVGACLVGFLLREHRTERLAANLSDDLLGTGDYVRNESASEGFGSAEGGADGGSH